jgi:hypothetical protein
MKDFKPIDGNEAMGSGLTVDFNQSGVGCGWRHD